MLREHEHGSRWAAVQSIAGKIGCPPQTLCPWLRETEPAMAAERSRLKQVEREVEELRRANESLRKEHFT